MTALPRLPDRLAGSALAALLRGEASVRSAAEQAGADSEALAAGVAMINR